MPTSRFLISAATAAFLATQMAGTAGAVTYNLTLNNVLGPEGGTGSFMVNGSVPSTGLDIFTAGNGLTSLSFSIDNNNFSLANALPGASVAFFNGSLKSIFYTGLLNGASFDLNTGGLFYSYVDLSDRTHSSAGTISDPSPSATPLPATWTMMLIGLAGLGVMLYRRKERETSAATVPA
jgi:hypothetical protein